jgi:hypothetical protein
MKKIINLTSKKMEKVVHPNTLTILNIVTGVVLVLAGAFYFLKTRTFDMSLSWIIFGAMYLVMESYACDCKQPKRVIVFAWLGFILSFALLVYYLVNL